MTNKHFIKGADIIIQQCRDFNEDYRKLPTFHAFLDLFYEFGTNFNKDRFEDYIKSKTMKK